MADEVLDSIVESFTYPDQDTAWHGSCLALAEVARRGLLLPHRVPELAPLMATALQFDLRRGAHRWPSESLSLLTQHSPANARCSFIVFLLPHLECASTGHLPVPAQ
jgi:hypothetical protein